MILSSNDLEQWGADVISGKDRSFVASLTRPLLSILSLFFSLTVRIRINRLRKGAIRQTDFATMVVSVGNLTLGGTGKTPVVEKLSRELLQKGRRVTILSRGYKSKSLPKPQSWEGISRDQAYDILPKVVSDHTQTYLKPPFAGDEPYMLAQNLPGAAVLVDKDRVKSARFALNYLHSDTFILDDGMQYLKIRHKFDIVLLDQSAPFGSEKLLPRGTLREPASHLKRADLIIITKCKVTTPPQLLERIRHHNATAGIVQCRHEAVMIEHLQTGEQLCLKTLRGKNIIALSGIATPESFESLLQQQGANILYHKTFSDHHAFKRKDVERLDHMPFDTPVDYIITTEKDAVRFPQKTKTTRPVYFLRIEICISQGKEHWDNALDHICGSEHKHPVEHGYDQIVKRFCSM